jgi:DNA gyrase subunit A
MGRDATGVRGIKLSEGQEVISLVVVGDGLILTASENGYGKLTPLEDFPSHGRGGQGVIALQTTERNGSTVAALQVQTDQEIMMISSNGTLVRTGVAEISIVGRNTQGVRLIRLDEGERLVSVEGIDSLGDDESVTPAEGAVAPAEDAPPSAPDAPNVH